MSIHLQPPSFLAPPLHPLPSPVRILCAISLPQSSPVLPSLSLSSPVHPLSPQVFSCHPLYMLLSLLSLSVIFPGRSVKCYAHHTYNPSSCHKSSIIKTCAQYELWNVYNVTVKCISQQFMHSVFKIYINDFQYFLDTYNWYFGLCLDLIIEYEWKGNSQKKLLWWCAVVVPEKNQNDKLFGKPESIVVGTLDQS